MEFSIKSGDPAAQRTGCLVVTSFGRDDLSSAARRIDAASGGRLGRLLQGGGFRGEAGQTLLLHELDGIAANKVLLVGVGAREEFTAARLRQGISAAIRLLDQGHAADALLYPAEEEAAADALYAAARDTVVAAAAASYRFERLKSKKKEGATRLKRLTIGLSGRKGAAAARRGLDHGRAIASGSDLARELGNLPGNICTPTYLAGEARKLGRRHRKLSVQVLDEAQMARLGMGSLLSVSRGSRQPAKLIVMSYKGGKAGAKPVVLVGKGLTFDAGGISIKPAAAMDEMKFDMCGGASVIGSLAACAELDLPLNVIGVVPASENLPDGDANKPGDVVTSLSGQTIEILNTDAEGRLILCDALTYSERFKPAVVVDVATLTGACIVALGHVASGLLANDDALADELLDAGDAIGDRAWRLPLWDDYQSQLDSNFADMANIGNKGAGTITAACFLSRYTKAFRWAHLDIAGTAWNSGADKGATGRPVPLLTQFLLKRAGVTE